MMYRLKSDSESRDIRDWTEHYTGLDVIEGERLYDPDRGFIVPNDRLLAHEVCHWLVCTDEERRMVDFGLAGTDTINPRQELLAREMECDLFRSAGGIGRTTFEGPPTPPDPKSRARYDWEDKIQSRILSKWTRHYGHDQWLGDLIQSIRA